MADPDRDRKPELEAAFERGARGEPDPSPFEGTRQPESGPSTAPLGTPDRSPTNSEIEKGYPDDLVSIHGLDEKKGR